MVSGYEKELCAIRLVRVIVYLLFVYVACPQAVSDQEKTGHKGASKPIHPELVSDEDQQHNKVRL